VVSLWRPVASLKVSSALTAGAVWVGVALEGTLTVQLLVMVCPGATVRKDVGVLGVAVQPAGVVRLNAALRSV
jgi:hypothetical protein